MGILGIANRTENWKTADNFCGLSKQGRVNLVRKLSGDEVPASQIKLELFWYGMRDYIYEHGGAAKESVDYYVCKFSDLREQVGRYEHNDGTRILKFDELQSHNYDASKPGNRAKLYSNLSHTEIDVVLETEDYVFIGEAKDESDLGTSGEHVLVHQLIRQYVMATILVDINDAKKKIVPFVVGNQGRLNSIKNTCQVRFMIDQGWLEESNIMSWDYIEELGKQ